MKIINSEDENMHKGKQDYIAMGSWDGSVKILNSENNSFKEIPGEEYSITSLNCDDDGEFLFAAYKNGTIKVVNIVEEGKPDYEVKQTIETGIDINSILFESNFF